MGNWDYFTLLLRTGDFGPYLVFCWKKGSIWAKSRHNSRSFPWFSKLQFSTTTSSFSLVNLLIFHRYSPPSPKKLDLKTSAKRSMDFWPEKPFSRSRCPEKVVLIVTLIVGKIKKAVAEGEHPVKQLKDRSFLCCFSFFKVIFTGSIDPW